MAGRIFATAGALASVHSMKMAASGYAPPMRRCPWPGEDPLYLAYHDREWGVPQHDDRKLFELLILEGAQAGLSWITILRKREAYRRAFHGFDAAAIAGYGDAEVAALMADAGIVRNRLKILAAIHNARAFLAVQEACGFGALLWGLVGGKAKKNTFRSMGEVPAKTPVSDAMSKELARRGFKFVGSTICYAFMQATGMVNDHLVGCFRRGEVGRG
jgi:DNA-3-methyladenine glycosylase I